MMQNITESIWRLDEAETRKYMACTWWGRNLLKGGVYLPFGRQYDHELFLLIIIFVVIRIYHVYCLSDRIDNT